MRTDIRAAVVVCLAAASPCYAQDTWGTLVSEASRLTVLELRVKAQGEDTPLVAGDSGFTLPSTRASTPQGTLLPSIQPGVPVVTAPASTTPAMPSAPTVTVQNPTPPPPPPPISVQSWATQPQATR